MADLGDPILSSDTGAVRCHLRFRGERSKCDVGLLSLTRGRATRGLTSGLMCLMGVLLMSIYEVLRSSIMSVGRENSLLEARNEADVLWGCLGVACKLSGYDTYLGFLTLAILSARCL